MQTVEIATAQQNNNLHEKLVQHIYALVHQPDAWVDVWHTLDAMNNNKESLSNLATHLSQAEALLEKMQQLQLNQSQQKSILNNIPMGIIQITKDARILSSNKHGLYLLEHIQDIRNKSYLHFEQPEQQSTFHKALLTIQNSRKDSASVHIGHINMHIQKNTHGQYNIFLSEHTHQPAISSKRLQEIYALTQNEALLCCELSNGSVSLKDAASAMGICVSTARSHLKKAFAKTETSSQAELVKMILLNPALTLHADKVSPLMSKARHSQLVKLASGRTISWAEYGDSRGYPVIFCHAITGCRLMVPSDEAVLKKHRIRLIVPDRAGYGKSTPANKPVMQQWLEDAPLFLAEIGIQRCKLMGYSAGGSFAMELAISHPACIEHLYLISSIAPLEDDSDLSQLLSFNRMLIRLSRNHKTLARQLLKVSLKVLISRPESYFEQIKADLPKSDRQILKLHDLKAQLIKVFSETCHQGVNHLVKESMMAIKDWHIDASQIACPVSIWHGQLDKHIPEASIRKLEKMLPSLVNRYSIKDAGHYLIFAYWHDIIATIGEELK